MYAYCFYYYLARSDMTGLMQATFYFGYNLMVCLGFFFMLGFVGWCVAEGWRVEGQRCVMYFTCSAYTLPHVAALTRHARPRSLLLRRRASLAFVRRIYRQIKVE